MKNVATKFLVTAIASSVLLTACGDSGSSSNYIPVASGTDINGIVTAPGGAVSMLRTEGTILIAIRDSLFNRAEAAISGLDIVEGALVELIEVDDLGVQVGEVLATDTTSINGDYTLTVPAGVDFAGNLIVRISGNGGQEMRAQVVEQVVDINPVTEFVLQKLVASGADLDKMTTASVIKLTGQVEEFDLTAGADLSAMFAILESETGHFVESQIEVIASTPGDSASVAGDYRLMSVGLSLHDDDQQYNVGTVGLDGEILALNISDNGSGSLTLTSGAEESFYVNQTFNNNNYTVEFYSEISATGDGDTAAAQIDDQSVLSIDVPFEEDIDGDFGFRNPPSVARLQKTQNNNVFIGTQAEASVRYLTVDTNNDGIKDAVNPDAREGDEVFKLLDIIAKQPAAMTTADLTGDFGRVYLETEVDSTGALEVRVENNKLSFDGFGSLDIGAAQASDLDRTGYASSVEGAQLDVVYSIADNGLTFTTDGVDQDAVFSDTFDFFAISAVDTIDDMNPNDEVVLAVNTGTTLAVKLANAMPVISSKTYRAFYLGIFIENSSTGLLTGRFNNKLVVNSDGVSGNFSQGLLELEKSSISAEVVSDSGASETQAATISVGVDGASTIVVTDLEGAFNLDGYFSHDASMGIFAANYAENTKDPYELGVVILVEVAAP